MNDFAGTAFGQDTEPHPLREQLLLYVDGELTEKEAELVRSHLEACWNCRARSAAIEETIAEFSRFDEAALTPQLPPPPNDWRGFNPQLRRLVAENGRPSLLSRWRGLVTMNFRSSPLAIGRLAAGAVTVALLLVAGVWWTLSQSWIPQVSAQELLQRSMQAETARLNQVAEPVVYRKLQVRRRHANAEESVMWESWSDVQRKQYRQRVADGQRLRFLHADGGANEKTAPALLRELEEVFKANHLDAQQPLSAAVYTAWRSHLKTKAESVTAVMLSGHHAGLKLTTSVNGPVPVNTIIEASLVVRRSDWHAVAQHLKVQGENEIRAYELSETAYEVLPLQALAVFADLAPTPASTLAATASPTTTPGRIATSPSLAPSITLPTAAALQEAEVAALYTLHQWQADLGEQIEVAREADRQIIVRGLVETEARKQQLSAALRALPLVTTQLQTVAEAARQTAAQPLRPTEVVTVEEKTDTAANPFEKRLVEYFAARGLERKEASRKAIEFADEIVAEAAAARSEAWALRRLAERYTTERAHALTPMAGQQLAVLVAQHLARLQMRQERLQTRLTPVLTALGGSPVAIASAAETDWQTAALRVFRSAEQFHQLTIKILAGVGHPIDAPEQAAQQQLKALAQLEAALTNLHQLVAR